MRNSGGVTADEQRMVAQCCSHVARSCIVGMQELVEFLSVVELLQEEYGMDIDGFTSAGGFSAYQQPAAASSGPWRGSSKGSRPSAGHSPPKGRTTAR